MNRIIERAAYYRARAVEVAGEVFLSGEQLTNQEALTMQDFLMLPKSEKLKVVLRKNFQWKILPV